jgi:hypothetical protein
MQNMESELQRLAMQTNYAHLFDIKTQCAQKTLDQTHRQAALTDQERESYGTCVRKFMQGTGQCFEVLQALEQRSALI